MTPTANYILVRAGLGALLLELGSGALIELNESAAFIWERVTSGDDPSEIARALAAHYDLDEPLAAVHVEAALRLPSQTVAQAPTDVNYRATDGRYVFEYRNQPTFLIDAAGEDIWVAPGAGVSAENAWTLLHAVAPKILSLRGHFVIHAGAVAVGNRVLAFSGLSGAGKSTTARAFASAGATQVCDDQLVVEVSGTSIAVPRGAEAAIDRWIAATAAELVATGKSQCMDLDRVCDGERLVLAEIGFLDRDRRNGSDYSWQGLSSTTLAGAVFRNLFHGSHEDAHWRAAMETSARIGQAVVGFALTPPDTLDALAAVARVRVSAGTLRS